jgi:hypothetical protein
MNVKSSKLGWGIIVFAILALALLLRMNGVFRGLTSDYIFHPDASKQVNALGQFLQGNYVWYVGSLFYDGYPLGLNHVDEWLLRCFLPAQNLLQALISPEAQPLVQPEKLTLYYWALSLRVLYGLGCLALLYRLTHRVLQSRGAALAALFLATISPLAIVVSHAATGDIGVDLFTLIALTCLCACIRRFRYLWLFLAGLATGLAFACKYQGALAGIAIGLFILLEFISQRRHLKALAALGLSLLGAFLGMLAGTPAALINWGRTMQNMKANFVFIQHYNVSPEFLAQPAGTRLLYCLTENIPTMIGALGWSLTLMAFAGLVFSARSFRTTLQAPERNKAAISQATLILSILTFPFLALLISIAGKPSVQPFHFSYLQPVLIFGAIYALRTLWQKGRNYKILAALLFVIASTEAARLTRQEAFFWGRGDNLHWARHLMDETFGKSLSPPSTATSGIIKQIYLEPGGLAVFRNRATVVTSPNAGFWNQIHIASVPDVPLSMDLDWLFPNGPVFPRNDRSFKIRQDSTANRHVVIYAPPSALKFGLRAGSWPVQLTLTYGGTMQQVRLTPHSQQIITLTPERWRWSRGIPELPEGAFLVPLEIQALGGNAWATVLADERETRVFNFFGGMIQERALLTRSDIPTPDQIVALTDIRYLEGDAPADLIPADDPTPGFRFPQDGFALPGGPYLLECVIQCQTPTAEVALKLDDFRKCWELTSFETTHHLEAGYQVVTTRFTKAFAPYECQLELKAISGRCHLQSWAIRPDVARIQQELQHWAEGGNRPSWVSQGKGTNAPAPAWDKAPITFGGNIQLSRLTVPAVISKREQVEITCEMAFDRFGLVRLEDYVFFIHLLNEKGHTVHTFTFPLWQTFSLGPLNIPFRFEPPAKLAPGTFALELGVQNAVIDKRLAIEGAQLSKRERQKRHYVFGRVTLTE